MNRDSSRGAAHDSHASDALADIALNSLGLVLIVMLVYVLLFQETTQKVLSAAQTQAAELDKLRNVETENQRLQSELGSASPDRVKELTERNGTLTAELETATTTISRQVTHIETLESKILHQSKEGHELKSQLENSISRADQLSSANDASLVQMKSLAKSNAEVRTQLEEAQVIQKRLEAEVSDLKADISRRTAEHKWSGLWRFRNQVEELIDHDEKSETVDWTIDYFVSLNVVDGKVTGALFGAHEIETDENKGNSQSFATISGTLSESGVLDVELSFSQGSADNGSEHLRCKLEGDAFVGRLESGSHRYGYRNYVGPTRGTRLTESVFK